MSGPGYRSIEIQISNYVNATLRVQSAQSTESWIEDEEAEVGQTVPRDGIQVWGAKTDDPQGSATLTVFLTGLGGITIQATNDSHGRSSVHFSDVSADISPRAQTAAGSMDDHSRFYVDLSPAARAWAGK